MSSGHFAIIRPRDDAASRQASDWGTEVGTWLTGKGYVIAADVDDSSPADQANISATLSSSATLILYFGHGDQNNWLTNGKSTISAVHMSAARGKAIVSIACRTACRLGPDAITAGVTAWLGFTIKVPVIVPHVWVDPIGEAIVGGIQSLSGGGSMQAARDQMATLFDQVKDDYDLGGKYSSHPAAKFGYYAAMALRDHVSVHGTVTFSPLP